MTAEESILKIGITGGIGSGKTTVCRMFELLDVPVYYSDGRARELMVRDIALAGAIRDAFGDEAYPDGNLDRAYLAGKVFGDPIALDRLNGLVHPAVMRDFARWAAEPGNRGAGYVIMESAIIFEAGLKGELDCVIVVSAPEEVRIRRVMERDNVTRADVEARIANQMGDRERESLADHIVRNDVKNLVWEQVLRLDQTFRNTRRTTD